MSKLTFLSFATAAICFAITAFDAAATHTFNPYTSACFVANLCIASALMEHSAAMRACR